MDYIDLAEQREREETRHDNSQQPAVDVGESLPQPTKAGGCCYALWLFVCHLYALCWKHFLLKKRRSLSTAFEVISPSLVLLVMIYGVQLSPTTHTGAFIYSAVPQFLSNGTAEAARTSPAAAASIDAIVNILEQSHLYQLNNPTSFFETVVLPRLGNPNASLASQLASLVTANTAASNPFIVPTFDGYLQFMDTSREQVGRAGYKSLEYLVPLVWHIMNTGKIALVPSTPEVANFVDYMTNSTFRFGETLLGASQNARGMFESVDDAVAYAESAKVELWAVIVFNKIDVTANVIDFTIRINSTLVPDTTKVVEEFPQGLGKKYQDYIFSGFATLQHEVSDYFIRRTRNAPATIRFGALPLMLSSCGSLVQHPLMFAQPTDLAQLGLLGAVLSIPPTPIVTAAPVDTFSVYYPCLFERIANCSGSSDVVACLQNLRSNYAVSVSCDNALTFANECPDALARCNLSVASFFSSDPLSSTECLAMQASSAASPLCARAAFVNNMNWSPFLTRPCQAEVETHCSSEAAKPNNDPAVIGCLSKVGTSGLSDLCRATLKAKNRCADDIMTVCPYNSIATFPTMCLHMQRAVLSSSCIGTDLFQNYIEILALTNASVTVPNTHQYVCRTAMSIDRTFNRGVAVGAFPAKAFDQNQFFANGAALIGLVAAMAYLYPFTATVRLTVQERERKQRMFLLCLGVRHWTMTACYVVMGFLIMFATAAVTSFTVLGFLPNVPFAATFALLMAYGLSLVGLALLTASLFNSSRTAAAASPFILFLMAVPAFATIGQVTWIGSVLSPSTLVLAMDYIVAFSQSSSPIWVLEAKLMEADTVLIGLFILYTALSLIVEHVRVMLTTSGIVGSCARRFGAAYKANLNKAADPIRRTRAYTTLQRRDYTGTATGGKAAEQISGSASELTTMPRLADERRLREGEVREAEGDEETNAGEVLSMSIGQKHSAAVEGARVLPEEPTLRVKVGAAISAFVDVSGVSWVFFGERRTEYALHDVSEAFYTDCINCVVGGTGSGKSTLLSIIVGSLPPSSGAVAIGGKPADAFDRQQMGVCFQDDVYWDCLSIAEHIEFVQLLKGNIDHDHTGREARTLLAGLGIDDRKGVWANVLPRGIRRRMSVAMAFAGGSRLVVLDEPTTFIDHIGRTKVWQLLKANEAGRCTIVATNFVEEAEVAAHVVMLEHGRAVRRGTPAELKADDLKDSHVVVLSRQPNTSSKVLVERVQQLAPRAALLGNVGLELSFLFPALTDDDSRTTIDALVALERDASALGITTVAIKNPGLDDVLLHLGGVVGSPVKTQPQVAPASVAPSSPPLAPAASADDELGSTSFFTQQHQPHSSSATTASDAPADAAAEIDRRQEEAFGSLEAVAHGMNVGSDREIAARLTGLRLFLQTFWGVFMKRFICAFNAKHSVILDMFFPLFCVLFAMAILGLKVPPPPSLTLLPSLFDGSADANTVLFTNATTMLATQRASFDAHSVPGVTMVALASAPAGGAVDLSAELWRDIDNHTDTRFGAIAFNDTFARFTDIFYNSSSAGDVSGISTFEWHLDTVLHNTSSPHALPAFLGLLDTIRLRTDRGRISTSAAAAQQQQPMIVPRSFPLPAKVMVFNAVRAVLDLVGSVLLLLPFTFLPAMYVSYIVHERETGFLAMQLGSSMSYAAYWLATFVWNISCFIIIALFVLLIFISFRGDIIHNMDEAWLVLGLLILYGCSSTSISYIVSKSFKRHTTAQNAVTLLHFTFGFALVTAAYAIELLPDNDATKSTKNTNKSLMKVLRVWPSYAMGEGFVNLASLPLFRFMHRDQTAFDALSPSLGLMALFPLYLGGLIVYETFVSRSAAVRWWKNFKLGRWFTRKCCSRGGSNADGLDPWERNEFLVSSAGAGADEDDDESAMTTGALSVQHLWKRYASKGGHDDTSRAALKDLSFDVKPGDHVVVIGLNGSGKTTLMNCFNGTLNPSHGDLMVSSDSLMTPGGFDIARKHLGFSASPAALPDFMTPYHLLHMMADLRGLRLNREREQHVFFFLQVLGLMRVRNKLVESLPDGVRNKVVVAMCLVGYPRLVFLDEVSSGNDATSRRHVWAALRSAPRGTSWVSTTQHLEEAAAVGSKVLVLDHGCKKFYGTVDKLRGQLGSGCTIIVRVDGGSTASAAIERHVLSAIENCQLLERNFGAQQLVFWAHTSAVASLFHQLRNKQLEPGASMFTFSVSTMQANRLLTESQFATQRRGIAESELRIDVRPLE